MKACIVLPFIHCVCIDKKSCVSFLETLIKMLVDILNRGCFSENQCEIFYIQNKNNFVMLPIALVLAC